MPSFLSPAIRLSLVQFPRIFAACSSSYDALRCPCHCRSCHLPRSSINPVSQSSVDQSIPRIPIWFTIIDRLRPILSCQGWFRVIPVLGGELLLLRELTCHEPSSVFTSRSANSRAFPQKICPLWYGSRDPINLVNSSPSPPLKLCLFSANPYSSKSS